ncbi:MAG: hypothetical protein ACR2OZ_07410 [Verrucomicrobiales bacterium]
MIKGHRTTLYVTTILFLMGSSSTTGAPSNGEKGESAGRRREQFCLLIEPKDGPQVIKPIPGSKLTGLVPGKETSVGVRYYSAREYAALSVTWETYLKRAEEAAARQLAKLTPAFVKDDKGFARYATIKGKSQLTASSVLAPGFRDLFKKSMGDELIVLLPDRFTVYVFPRTMGEYKELGRRVIAEYEAAVYPVSYEVFLVNRHGLSCLGSFQME